METSSLLAEMSSTAPPATPKTPPIESESGDGQLKSAGLNQGPQSTVDNVISKEEDRASNSGVSNHDNSTVKTNHNHESSIKLKRCKHGRIIIKDHSKRKSTQPSDNDANSTSKNKDESNNNHIGFEVDNGVENKSNHSGERLVSPGNSQPDPPLLSHGGSKKLETNHSQHQPRTPPLDHDERLPHDTTNLDKSLERISPADHNSKNRSTIRIEAIDRSSSRSLSPSRLTSKVRESPPRRSRRDRRRSRRKDRSVSRDRSVSSRRRRISSPSPRRRERSRSPGRRGRKSRRRRSPERRKSNSSRHYRRRSPSDSPGRRMTRSRSITPTRNSSNHRYNHRATSRSRSRERSKYNDSYHYSNRRDKVKNPYERSSIRRSPNDHRNLVETTSSAGTDGYLPISRDKPDVQQPSSIIPVLQTNSKPPLVQEPTNHPPLPLKPTPEVTRTGASPKEPSTTRSPATPSIDESSSSDIYDPEGPIVPISPGDSPPISPVTDTPQNKPASRGNKNEKNGEDDVPSSAVQLNQHEKYLQKLNRQERVVEEVKVALRPFYQKRSISKEQYKDVLRRAVPKICHSKNGEINPVKIRSLVDAYVKKMKH